MLISLHLHEESGQKNNIINARSPSASLTAIGQVNKYTTAL